MDPGDGGRVRLELALEDGDRSRRRRRPGRAARWSAGAASTAGTGSAGWCELRRRSRCRWATTSWRWSWPAPGTGPPCWWRRPTCTSRPTADRLWGAFAPLYSLRTEQGWGPNVFDLDRLGRVDRRATAARWWARCRCWPRRRATRAPTRPCRAGSGTRPTWTSPRCPSWPGRPGPGPGWPTRTRSAAPSCLPRSPTADAGGQVGLVDRVLDELAPAVLRPRQVADPAFARWVDEQPAGGRLRPVPGRGRAPGPRWQDWPDALARGTVGADDYDVRRGRPPRLRPVVDGPPAGRGVAPAGRAGPAPLPGPARWGARPRASTPGSTADAYGWGAAVGAPPDDFFAAGQNWGFPPVRPAGGPGRGPPPAGRVPAPPHGPCRHAPPRPRHGPAPAVLGARRHGGHRRRLRALSRPTSSSRWWPSSRSRAGCLVVGEDLGTVPDEVREAMDRHRVLRSYVAEFSLPSGPDQAWPAPTTAWWPPSTPTTRRPSPPSWPIPRPAPSRCESAPAPAPAGPSPARRRPDQSELSLLRALLEVLADSDAPGRAGGPRRPGGRGPSPRTCPGTGAERPNWVLRLPVTLAELAADPAVADAAGLGAGAPPGQPPAGPARGADPGPVAEP